MRIYNCHIMILLLFLPCLFINFCFAAELISANQTLYGNQTLVSAGGNFELGIFNPGKSAKFYIGIWYKLVDQQTVVWVANRETPLLDKESAQLKILDGNLELLDGSENKIWSTDLNSSISGNSLVATLLDDGNLVLRDTLSNSTIWDSFDNPTHTFLPGARLGYDKRTKRNQLLTSWKNSEDPAPGLFTLELVPNNKEYIIRWNGTQKYWSSGVWNDHIFSQVPEMRLNYIFNFSFVDNENETYFTYSLYNKSLISRLIIDTSGQIKQVTWIPGSDWNQFWSQPRQQCQVYTSCGPFSICNENTWPFCDCLKGFVYKSSTEWDLKDYSRGCVRETSLQCGNNNTFWMNTNVIQQPDHSQLLAARSINECESYCLSNCSCTAYAFDEDGCSIWNGELLNLQQLAEDGRGKAIYIKLDASSSSSRKDNKGVVAGAIVGGIATVIVILGVLFAVLRRRRRRSVGTLKVLDPSFGHKDLQGQ